MSDYLEDIDRNGQLIEVGSAIKFWKTDGWNGGSNREGKVVEIKAKTYIVHEFDSTYGTVDGKTLYTSWASGADRSVHRVHKARENNSRYSYGGGPIKPTLVRNAAEQRAWEAEQEVNGVLIRAAREEQDRQRKESYARREDGEKKSRLARDAMSDALATLAERHKDEYEGLLTANYRKHGLTPADLDLVDDVTAHAWTVRPEGWSSAVNV